MKSYIVRVYRYKKDEPRKVVGVVEEIGQKTKKAFTNIEELWEILNPAKKKVAPNKAREKTKSPSR